jgi:5-methylcytosine-specific restriction endonuclease McrA
MKHYTIEELELLEQFNHRCVKCQRPYDTIHECVPRSHGKDSMLITNRVPICAECHDWAHRVGTKISAPRLLWWRAKRLSQYGND